MFTSIRSWLKRRRARRKIRIELEIRRQEAKDQTTPYFKIFLSSVHNDTFVDIMPFFIANRRMNYYNTLLKELADGADPMLITIKMRTFEGDE